LFHRSTSHGAASSEIDTKIAETTDEEVCEKAKFGEGEDA
jgi:hypothetical protein